MPAEMKSVEGSSGGGISGQDGNRRWSRSSKKDRKPSRSSADVRMQSILGGRGRLSGSAAGGDLLAHLLERAPDEARDVHLRDPDLLGDLRLREAFPEAQVDDAPLALVQRPEARREDGAVLAHLVLVLQRPERLERVEVGVVAVAGGRRERHRRVGLAGLERLQDLLLVHAGRLGKLGDRGRALELDRELLEELRQTDVQLLEAARYAHRPALVAEVALDLPDDVRRRIGRELDAAVDVEAVDRLDEADAADLHQVLELLAPVRVPAGERAHERQVLLDQALAGLQVAPVVVAAQEVAVRPPARFPHASSPFEPWARATRFSRRSQCPPSRSSTEISWTSVSSRRRMGTPCSGCRSRSVASSAASSGPIAIPTVPSPTRRRTVISGPAA